MTTASCCRRFGILIATASAILTACSPSSSGGSGQPVQQQPIETVSSDFPFTATGAFTVGDAPANAAFSGGVATDGAWVVRDGETGTVVFTTPTRNLSFDANIGDAVAQFAKPIVTRVLRKTTCGVSDQGLDNSEAYGQEMFMRGGFNDWGNPSPTDEFLFVNFGGGVYQAEFQMTAGEYNYKVGSAGWEVERATERADILESGDTQPLIDPGPGGPEGIVNVPTDGCYNFTLNVTDADNALMTMTEVDLSDGGGGTPATCGVSDQGLDNSEAYGQEMFMRGGFNDWGNPSPTDEFLFVNFGGGVYQAEFQMTAGEYNYKVGSAGWEVERATERADILESGDTQPLIDPGPGGPEGIVNVPTDGCYNFTLNVTDADNALMTMTEVDLSGGGGGKETCGLEDQGLDNAEAYGQEMFMRGGFNDWGNPSPTDEFLFINFGGGVYQAEFEMVNGEYNYKVGSAGWEVERATERADILESGDTQPLIDPGPGGPEGIVNVPSDGCYNFTLNVTDADNVTITMTEVELGGGGPPPVAGTTDFTADNTDGSSEVQAVEGMGAVSVAFTREGSLAPAIKVLTIEANNGDVAISNFTWTANPVDAPDVADVQIVYRNASGDYSNTTIVIEGQSFTCVPNASDEFGCTATVSTTLGSVIDFTVENGGTQDPTGDFTAFTGDGEEDIIAVSGNPQATTGEVTSAPQENEVIVYYLREEGDFAGWNLHLFPREPATGDWTIFDGAEACVVEGSDSLGTYFRITLPPNPCYDANPDPLDTFPTVLGFLIHDGPTKSPDGDITHQIAEDGNVIWIREDSTQVFTAPPSDSTVSIVGRAAHWVDASTVLWNHGDEVTAVELLWSPDASISVVGSQFIGNFEMTELTPTDNPQPQNQLELGSYPAYAIPINLPDDSEDIARSQIVAVGLDVFGLPIEATFVQTPGALDALYEEAATQADLGVNWSGTTPTISVWAPTALTDTGVTLNIYSDPDTLEETVEMTLDEASGVWSATGDSSWDRKYYDFTLDVYSYAVNAIVTNTVTDPYSISLSANSQRSQVVNLDDQDLKPAGWDDLTLPDFGAPEDIVVYEQQMRDYSASDFTVPEDLRGKYQAFALDNTDGHAHLQALSDAGLTHMHLLPSFDIATIEEIRDNRVELDDPVDDLCAANPDAAGLCPTYSGMTIRELLEQETAADPTSTFQQEVVVWLKDLDGYNWGYDPWHYGVPEGSYASDPEGVARIIEYREMIQGLANKGLRLVTDMVYNHTNQGGQGAKSVLDRVVPGYYQRYNETSGAIESSTCCSNTASEFAMMGKLMDDTMIRFVEDYRITGYRYDLMGFHTKAQMEALLATLRDIDPSVYIYGEGWNFGEVASDRRFVQATQLNLAGTGLGTFSDRIRDAVRGGGPFDSGAQRTSNQGFISGGGYDPNETNTADGEAFLEEGLCTSDQLRATLAGSVQSYSFEDRTGTIVTGGELGYPNCVSDTATPTGYVDDPEEIINYASSHDNETIWDISQYKHPTSVSAADRVRADNIGVDTIVLAQGVPFLHSGQDLLRSKSVDRDSFDFGDWFNRQDFSGMDNNWAIGLPNAEKNENEWPDIAALFQNPNSIVTSSDIQFAAEHTQEMLQIRDSSVLYRLRTGDQIKQRVAYFNTGPDQVQGLIVQGIDGCFDDDLTPEFGFIVNIFNANDEDQTIPLFTDETFTLHPVQQNSVDTVVQTATHDASGFFVPARTTAVFVRADQDSCTANPLGADIFVRGFNQDWNATADNELVFDGVDKFERVLTLADTTAGDLSFKVADADWSVVNCGAGIDPLVDLDTPYPLNCAEGSGDLTLNVAATGDYKFSVTGTDTSDLVLTVYSSAYPVDIFVRGFNADWNATDDNRLDLVASNSYQTSLPLPDPAADGALTFKIADADWSSINCGSNGSNATLGVAYALNCADGSGDILLDATEAGEYSFTVDATDPANPLVKVEQAPLPAPIFVRGLNADWALANPMTYVGGTTYHAVIPLTGVTAEDLTFKVADADWSVVNCGADADPAVNVDTPYVLNCADGSGDLELNTTEIGTFDFTVDAADTVNPVLSVSGP